MNSFKHGRLLIFLLNDKRKENEYGCIDFIRLNNFRSACSVDVLKIKISEYKFLLKKRK